MMDLREILEFLLLFAIVMVLVLIWVMANPNRIFCPECGYKTWERSHYVYCPYDGTKLNFEITKKTTVWDKYGKAIESNSKEYCISVAQ